MVKPKQETDCPPQREGERQTSNLRLRWSWTEASIWSDSMLTALENGVKGGKWFSLIDKVARPYTLSLAWEKVKANKGAGGVDGIQIKKFDANCLKYLDEIRSDLIRGRYKPQAVKRVYIPKGNGEERPLGIPTLKDRVVQMAMKMAIEPIFEESFHENSHGFRPRRGAKDALRKVDGLLQQGYTHVVDVDFQAYFDTIPHEQLMELVKEKISDGPILELVRLFLEQEIMEGMERWKPDGGTPQGGVISPLLANIYLNPLDHLLGEAGIPMHRYADDFVIMATSLKQAEAIKKFVENWADRNGLIVHPEKSKIVDYSKGEGFAFLGYYFQNGKRLVRPSSMKKLRDAVRKKTPRASGKGLHQTIESLNRTLKGWYAYFKHADAWCLQTVDGFVRRRLRSMLRSWNKHPGFGSNQQDHKRWPNSYFASLGLFTTLEAQILEKANRRAAC